MRYEWSKLNHLQKGRYAEYYAKMSFTSYGFEVYTAEVDDRGIDFVVRKEPGGFLEVQVKSVTGNNYSFIEKSKFKMNDQFLITLIRFIDGMEPQLYLFRGSDWNCKNNFLVDYDYEGKKSKPEYGINLSKKSMPELMNFEFNERILKI